VAASVGLLEERGPALGHPHSSGVKGSKHGRMRELRVQHAGRPLRLVPIADAIYDQHLEELRREEESHG